MAPERAVTMAAICRSVRDTAGNHQTNIDRNLGSMMRLMLKTGLWLLVAWSLLLSACKSPPPSIRSILARQAQAIRKLPDEERALLLTTDTPEEIVDPQDLLPAGELALSAARSIALEGNPDVQAARARIEAALAGIAEARSLYMPYLTFAQTTTRTFHTPQSFSRFPAPFGPASAVIEPASLLELIFLDPTPGNLLAFLSGFDAQRRLDLSQADHNSFSDHSTAFSARWVLFDGFGRDAQIMINKYQYMASVMSLADVQRLLVQAVDTAYYQIQLGAEAVRIAQGDEEFSQSQLDDARARYEARTITKADVLNFEVRVMAARANVVAANGIRDLGRVALAELLGTSDALSDELTFEPLADETAEQLSPPEPEPWIGRAMGSRPDLQRARELLSAQEEGIALAKSRYSPQVAVLGSYGWERLSNMAYSKDDQSAALGIEMRWDLYTGGARSAQLRKARASWWEATSLVKRKELSVISDVRSAVIKVVDAQQELQLQRINLTSAEENRRLVQTQYAEGKASLVHLNQAQRDLIETEGKLAQARIRLRQAWSDLRAASGTAKP